MSTKRMLLRPLSIAEILRWADIYRHDTGKWPTKSSGGIPGARFESWARVDACLRAGHRGLPDGGSLARLLADERGVRNIHDLPLLSEELILDWADKHYQRTGQWPQGGSGKIPGSDGEKWRSVEHALRTGQRGLPGGSSLAQLLAERREVRNRKQLPPLTTVQILEWADRHHERTNCWPTGASGAVVDAPGETWLAIDMALIHGRRGHAGGSSLAMLLAKERGARNVWTRPPLTVEQILAWADAFHARNGVWPDPESGAIGNGETWASVNHALRRGSRGLPGGTTLARLLGAERGVRNRACLPPLTQKLILTWARRHQRRTGDWPTRHSGPIADAPDETWAGIDAALSQGSRGLRAGSSLAKLLSKYGLRRHHRGEGSLSLNRILRWADAHFERTGKWPNVKSGEVAGTKGERWDLIDNALRLGHRGLRGGSSLLSLLARKRGVRHTRALPPLTLAQILEWARHHRQRTGAWPSLRSGEIADAPGETWAGVDNALRTGRRGLPGGSSLARLLAEMIASEASTANRTHTLGEASA